MTNNETLWENAAKKHVAWFTPWDKLTQGGFDKGDVQWFINGKLNVSYNCLDKHLPTKKDHPALIWEGDSPSQHKTLTFSELHQQVCLMANGLKSLGVKKGDTVGIYMPMIPEAAIAMLACTRIGAIHTVIFAGFSAHALNQRLKAASCKVLITADGYQRGGKYFDLKVQADEAVADLTIKTVLIRHRGNTITFNSATTFWWHELKMRMSDQCEPEPMDAEDPLFILYTSGSTGQPKGVVHTTGGYLVQTAYSHDQIFRSKDNDVFWCTADIGWITGHSYTVYAPLCNGITTVMFAGLPTWPDASRSWSIIDKHHINVFYTAPTAIRAMKRAGDEWLAHSSRQSLRILGSVGEPINPDVWRWYYEQVGQKRCEMIDTWWQTETGAIMLCPQQPTVAKPGAACQPLPGIEPVLLDDNDQELSGACEGVLAIKTPWPAIARTIAGDHARYCKTYFRNGYYITGDGAKRDVEGDYWIIGRIDDVLNVSGHRLGTAEIESALLTHPAIAEAAVVGIPHPLKGEAIYAFVSLKANTSNYDALESELITTVQKEIGAIAKPENIHVVADLPKTRSGKIMRRILRQLARGDVKDLQQLGDLSTLANSSIVEQIMEKKD